jgi:hypothetical protein
VLHVIHVVDVHQLTHAVVQVGVVVQAQDARDGHLIGRRCCWLP